MAADCSHGVGERVGAGVSGRYQPKIAVVSRAGSDAVTGDWRGLQYFLA